MQSSYFNILHFPTKFQPSRKLATTISDSFVVSVLTLIPPQPAPLPPPSFTPNLITVILSTTTYRSLRLPVGYNSLLLTDHIVDLDVTVDSTLKYSVHINQLEVVAMAKSRTGLLFRCFVTRDINVLRKANIIITYIRPLCSIWSPTQAGLIDNLESVQRQFTKLHRR